MVGKGKVEDDEGIAAPERRVVAAFRAWLVALATDPDAATAASMAYEALPSAGRDAWLDALEAEAPSLEVPTLALYAPLLGVETDERRSARIGAALAAAPFRPPPPEVTRALSGRCPSGESLAVLAIPLYLDFVELLVCRYRCDGIISARRGPLSSLSQLFGAAATLREVDGAELTEAPFAVVLEDLAHAVVADRRQGRAPSPELMRYEFLFTPDLSESIRD